MIRVVRWDVGQKQCQIHGASAVTKWGEGSILGLGEQYYQYCIPLIDTQPLHQPLGVSRYGIPWSGWRKVTESKRGRYKPQTTLKSILCICPSTGWVMQSLSEGSLFLAILSGFSSESELQWRYLWSLISSFWQWWRRLVDYVGAFCR